MDSNDMDMSDSSDEEFGTEEAEVVFESEESEYDGDESIAGSTTTKKRKMTANQNLKLLRKKVFAILRKDADSTVGEFAVSEKLPSAPLVIISVKNIENGRIRFPLYENEADKIIESFEQSPYGKGSETVVDTSVRNSWQLSPEVFEILDPDWDWEIFMKVELLPRIKKEMSIECSFSASLYKLLLYKTGSFFKPHRDSEKADGMFATLVIQLPSKYKGGELVVSHDGKKKTMDFSSSDSVNNGYSTFFSVFYCDCEHEILPVTEGVRLCLIYNLIAEKSDSIPVAQRKQGVETELNTLFQNWNTPGKLVYALKHKYSESNLSFESLKTTDKSVANTLKSVAEASGLDVYLAIFNKESSGEGEGDEEGYYGCDDADFDSNDEDITKEKIYELNNLKSIDGHGHEILLTSKLIVDFKKEVMPKDCFANIEPYKKTCRPTGNEGIDICKYYRSAALVLWRKEFTLQVLQASKAPEAIVDELFLQEVEKHAGKEKYDKINNKILLWAKSVVSYGGIRREGVIIPLINAILSMDNLELVQNLFSHCVPLNPETIPLLVFACEKYGWESLSSATVSMFDKVYKKTAIEKLNLLIGNGDGDLGEEKKKVCHNVFQSIWGKKDLSSFRYGYDDKLPWYAPNRPLTPEEKLKKQKEEEDALLSICLLAQKINFNMLVCVQSKSCNEFVPVLLRLVPENSKILDKYWVEVARHFVDEMEKEAAKPAVVTNWCRDKVKITCRCFECATFNPVFNNDVDALRNFLKQDKQAENFKIGEKRRKHLQKILISVEHITHETSQGARGTVPVLTVKKTRKTGDDEIENRNLSRQLLPKLRSVIPKNC